MFLKRFTGQNERGVSTVEYGLLLVGVAVALVGILRVTGLDTGAVMCRVVAMFDGGTVCGSDDVLFADDFEDGYGRWDVDMGGNWENVDGELCAVGGGEHRAYSQGSTGSDYTISFDATLVRGNGYGVFFRAVGDRITGYTFQYDPGYGGGQFIIRKWVNGYEIWPPFAAARAPNGFRWTGVQRHVEVDIRGNTFTASVDGNVVVSGQDDTYTKGQIGLRVWTPSEACFDNVIVTQH